MLAGVLLHVAESARPIDLAREVTTAGQPIDHMPEPALFLGLHIHHLGLAHSAVIRSLSAALREEPALLEFHRGATRVLAHCRDATDERTRVAIVVVSPHGGHRAHPPPRTTP